MKEYWNELFKNREIKFVHEKILEEKLPFFLNKRVIEFGAGDGRNSLFLKNNGIHITALDYSKEGLLKIKSYDPEIKTLEFDIENDDLDISSYNLILMVHYFPSFEILRMLIEKNQKEIEIFLYTFVKDEVEGAKETIGISYDEIEKIKKLGHVIESTFVDDIRGKSFLLILKIIGDENAFE